MSSATRTAGTRLGPYEVVARLGAGGMGEVYRARDTKLNRDVALKFLPESVAGDAARLARFEYEAQTLASLNHPNIAQVYGFLDGALVMELLDGETLAERLSAGPLPVRKAVEYGSQIARGLAAAHDRGIVHRDLKPDNVFVLRDGHVKIIDFGLAREVVPVSSIETAMTIAQTRTEPGVLMGTVGYMAPEQIRGDPLDARADLFSFGSVLYEMLTGQRAFKRETAAETMTAILREDPTDLVAARPEVSPGLERIVRHCLEKNAIERFQTARDVAFALDTLTGSTRRDPVVPAVAFSKVRAKRSGIERAVWASLVSLLALAIAWLLIRTPSQSPASVAVVYRALVPLPEGVAMATATTPLFRLAISADGRRLAFVGTRLGRPPTIWVQSTDESEARELAGTENGFGPILSPDGKSIAFSVNQTLKRVDLDGGSPVTVGPEVHGQ